MTTSLILAMAAQSVSGCLVEVSPPSEFQFAQSTVTPIASTDRWIVLGNAEFPGQNQPDGIVLVHERGALDDEVHFSAALDSPVVGDWAQFGYATAVYDDLLVIGAPGPFNALPSTPFVGAAYVYRYDGLAWRLEATLPSPRPQLRDRYAMSVAVGKHDGREIVMVGAYGQIPRSSTSSQAHGAIFAFKRRGADWSLSDEINPADAAIPRSFGEVIAFDGQTLITHSDRGSSPEGTTHVLRYSAPLGEWLEEAALPNSVGFDIDEDTIYFATYDRFADSSDVLVATRDSALGAWSHAGPPLFSLSFEVTGLGFDQGRLLVTRPLPPRLFLFEPGVTGAWTQTWQPTRIEAENTSSVALFPFGEPRFSRDQVVLAVGGNGPFTGSQVFLADTSCAEIGDVICLQPDRNSTGRRGKIRVFGDPVIGADEVTLQAVDLPANVMGLFFAGRVEINPVAVSGSEGVLCIGGDLGRYKGMNQICYTSDSGQMELGISPLSLPTSTVSIPAVAGETWMFQGWHRDNRDGVLTSDFTSAREVVWQ